MPKTNTPPPFESPSIPKDQRFETPTRLRWTTERYHYAIEQDVFQKYDRIELINGEIWQKVRRSPLGCATETALRQYFYTRFSLEEYNMDGIGQLSLPPHTSAEPDFKITKRHPVYEWLKAEDTFLVIEVMETNSVYRDRLKAKAYAAGGIREYWIVNLPERCVEVHTQPNSVKNTYDQIISYGGEEFINSPFVGEVLAGNFLLTL